ncbi:MAG: regulatory iron-sulfur-containing complex subunit RicT [Candidatus Bipolaricaulota bacterium]
MPVERYVLVRLLGAERESALFDAADVPVRPGDRCVVDHGGLALGVVERELSADEGLRGQLERVVRPAADADIEAHQYNQADAERALRAIREAVTRHGLPMHLVAAVYSLDRKVLRIHFTAPHRVDFRELLRDLASRFGTRIELRQMGTRDEARLRGGLGRCGLEICCHRFLRDPKPIPMEYAYDQELFVSPERITGLCGRLMCCLAYERDTYLAELAELPKLGAMVMARGKQGKVVAHSVFARTVTMVTEDRDRVTLDVNEVTPLPTREEA